MTRPGRIDRVIQLGYMDRDCKRQLANRVLQGCSEPLEHFLQELQDETDPPETAAQYQERCRLAALLYLDTHKERL